MSKFQRRHYEAIAETLAFSDASDRTITFFVNMFGTDNYNFDPQRFRGRIEDLRYPCK
jgi:hypothetical protein